MSWIIFIDAPHVCAPPEAELPKAGIGSLWECECKGCWKRWRVRRDDAAPLGRKFVEEERPQAAAG